MSSRARKYGCVLVSPKLFAYVFLIVFILQIHLGVLSSFLPDSSYGSDRKTFSLSTLYRKAYRSLTSVVYAAPPPVVATQIDIFADGSPTFDAVSFIPPATNPGDDSSANNGIVRTLDTITYEVHMSLNGEDAANTRATVTLPPEMRWTNLPTACLTTGVTPVSSISLDELTMVCNLGIMDEGTASVFRPVAQVRQNVSNNSVVNASVSTTADGANTDNALSVNTIVTAGPKADLVKTILVSSNPVVANGPLLEDGKIITYGIQIIARKGSEGLNAPLISFIDTFSNDGPSNTAQLYTWGPGGAAGGCGVVGDVNYVSIMPFPLMTNTRPVPWGAVGINGSATIANSVSSSGVITCIQGGGPGTPITVDITGADYSMSTIPERKLDGSVISVGDGHMVSGYLNVWVPESDVLANGTAIVETNTYSTIDPNGVSGLSNYGPGSEDLLNNTQSIGVTTTPVGNHDYRISFDGDPRMGQKTGSRSYIPGDDVDVHLIYQQYIDATQRDVVLCLKVDKTQSELVDLPDWGHSMGAYAFLSSPPYNLITPNPRYALIPDGIVNSIPVEYAVSPNTVPNIRDSTCSDGDGPWFTGGGPLQKDTTTVPGGAAAVTKIRIKQTTLGRATAPFKDEIDLSPRLHILPSVLPGSVVPAFGIISLDDGATWQNNLNPPLGSINPLAPNYAFDAYLADRINIVNARISVDKITLPGDSIISAQQGDIIDFQIETRLESVTPSLTSVSVTDTLPAGIAYVAGSAATNCPGVCTGTVSGPIVTPGGGGTTILTWSIAGVTAGLPLELITYQAQVDPTITRATLTNSVVVSSPIDTTSVLKDRSDIKTINVYSPGDLVVEKYVSTPVVEIGDPITYEIGYGNYGPDDATEAQIIEILPWIGDNRVPASAFAGTLELGSISGTNGETFEYTLAPPATVEFDPCHVSNVPFGATFTPTCPIRPDLSSSLRGGLVGTGGTVWCSLLSGGACPANLSEVTAVRVSVPGIIPASASQRRLTLVVQPIGNQADDVYTNEHSGRIAEINEQVISNDIPATVVAGSIGNSVWYDTNGNGVQDGAEAGIAGVTVNLLDAFMVLVDSTLTDGLGQYTFNNVHSGTYTIQVVPPAGAVPTYDLDGIITPDVSAITLNQIFTGTDLTGVDMPTDGDFGYLLPGTVGNQVFFDINGDGIFNPLLGESGISGVAVSIYYDSNDNGVYDSGTDIFIDTTFTDSDGIYTFSGLSDDDGTGTEAYMLVVTDGNGITSPYVASLGTPTVDNNGQNPSGYQVILTPGSSVNTTGDFGYVPSPSIGNQLFYDNNSNGVFEPGLGELGIAGVEVTLYTDINDNGVYDIGTDTFVDNLFTDNNGIYVFTGLSDNDGSGVERYVVVVTDVNGIVVSYAPSLGAPNTDNNGQDPTSYGVVLSPPLPINTTADFGYIPTGTIGNQIYSDNNANGIFEPGLGEVGIAGIWVSLYTDVNNSGTYDVGVDTLVANAVTDSNGIYIFTGIPDDDGSGSEAYMVVVNDTAGVLGQYTPILGASGVDSNGQNPAGYQIILSPSALVNITGDFGYYPPQAAGPGSPSDGGSSAYTAPMCSDPMPDSAPDLFQITRNSPVTLYFTPGGGPSTYYYISYGRTPEADEWGVQVDIPHGDGVMSYTINGLDDNEEYYFRIREGNGCAPGYWSNTKSIGKRRLASTGSPALPGLFFGLTLLLTTINVKRRKNLS